MTFRKNRKKKNGFVFPAPFASLIVLGAALALVYIWLSCRCDALGRDIKAFEIERTTLHKQLLNEEYRWTRMKSPENMERALARLGIAMGWPRRNQVVYLYDAPEPIELLAGGGENALTYVRRDRTVMND